MADLQALRASYRAQKAALFESVQASGSSTRGIRTVLQKLARLADDTLRALSAHAGLPATAALSCK